MRVAIVASDGREVLKQYSRSTPDFGTAPDALLQGFKGRTDVEIHVLSNVQKFIPSPEKLAENIWFHSLHVPKLGWLRTGYQGCIRAVRRRLRQIQPDIVHGQGTERDSAVSAVLSGFPNVITVHGNMRLIARVNKPRPFTYGWLAARLEAITLPRAMGVVCITRYTEQAVSDLARRTWVVPNAVDASFFEIVRKPIEPKTILCVGHITVRKNQNRFIEALDPIASVAGFKVLFLGAASESDDYARKFFELVKTRAWCRYGGMINREQLKQHFAQATALVLPSLEDNCPMVVLEAMASGVPVAAARVGGVPELIEDARTGLLLDPLQPASMAGAVQRLIGEPAFAARLAADAKREAQVRFHPQEIAARHLEIYGEVIKSRS